jgi:hypothetical protein
VVAYQRRTREAGSDKMQWEGLPFIAVHHAEPCGPVEGVDGSVWRQGGRAGMHPCGAEAHRYWALCRACEGEHIQVFTRCNKGCQHTAPTRLHARAGSTTQGPRRRAFSCIN